MKKFGSALLYALLTFALQVVMLACALFYVVKLFPTQAECLFVSVLISSVDGSSIDDAINKRVSKERFSQSKQDMLKLINIINNYIVFLLAQIIVPFLQQDYFPSFARVHILKVLVALLV